MWIYFFLWTSSIVCVFDSLTFDIFLTFWHLFYILTSFWHFDIFFNLNHLGPSQGHFIYIEFLSNIFFSVNYFCKYSLNLFLYLNIFPLLTPASISKGKQTTIYRNPAVTENDLPLWGDWKKIYFSFRLHPTILPIQWDTLPKELHKHNLQISLIEGNGYCFLNSVLTCLYQDYGDTLTLEDCITKSASNLCLNHRNYMAFHHSEKPQYAADKLVADALDFFHTGHFNSDVVDLLLQIKCDVLKLHLFIYQQHDNHVQVLKFTGNNSLNPTLIHPWERVVRVRFTHNNIHSGGNHYDAINTLNRMKLAPTISGHEDLLPSELSPSPLPSGKINIKQEILPKINRLFLKRNTHLKYPKWEILIDLTNSDEDDQPNPTSHNHPEEVNVKKRNYYWRS